MNIAGYDIGVCSWSLHPKDTQELIAWPVGSGMFGNKDEGAIATCE